LWNECLLKDASKYVKSCPWWSVGYQKLI
jgi:hypothetical protein